MITFQQTQDIISDIEEICTWTRCIERSNQVDFEVRDHAEIARTENWLAESKEKIFKRCVELRGQ